MVRVVVVVLVVLVVHNGDIVVGGINGDSRILWSRINEGICPAEARHCTPPRYQRASKCSGKHSGAQEHTRLSQESRVIPTVAS